MNTPTETHRPPTGLHRYVWISVVSKAPLWWLAPRLPGLAVAIFVAPELWLLHQILMPNASGLGRVIRRFATPAREICLTIDDGPDPRTTPVLLDLLDAHGAKAVFFLIGQKVRVHPDLARLIVSRGHEVANHTDTHPLGFFWCSGPRRTAAEIDACSAAIERATGNRPRFFRPPAGITNPFVFRILARRGLALMGWSGRGRETGCSSPDRPLRRLIGRTRPGAILLTHESGPNEEIRLAVIEGLLSHLSREGFRCVPPPAESSRAEVPDRSAA